MTSQTRIAAPENAVNTPRSVVEDARSFTDLLGESPQPAWVFDPQTLEILAVNDAALAKYRYSRAKFLAMNVRDLHPDSDKGAFMHCLEAARESGCGQRRWVHLRSDGSRLDVDIAWHGVRFAGRDAALVLIGDITDLVRSEQALQLQTVYFRQLFENSPEGIVILDRKDRIVDANQGFRRLFGYDMAELKNHSINELIVPPDKLKEASRLSDSVLADRVVERETVRQRRDGTLIDVSVLGYPIRVNGEQIGVFGIYKDITERRRIAGALAYQASHDPLTDLLNRRGFDQRARTLVEGRSRESRQHALIYLDLDQFKVVNDTCGHTAGDRVLTEVARLLRAQVRESDTLARLGGDEFAILLANCPLDRAEAIAAAIVERINTNRFAWREQLFKLGASAGVVGIDESVADLTSLMSAADAACFMAKEKGRNRVQVYRKDDAQVARRHGEMSWVSRINQALESDRFVLYFQKISSLPLKGEGGAAHYEILLRMCGEDGELVPPATFIAAAERYNLMPSIDRWVVDHVFAELARRGTVQDTVCINLSGTTLSDPAFADFVADRFNRYRIEPGCVCFEVTETSAIANLEGAAAFMASMREMGCSIALDDFGSGMSSFTYLKSLPVDFLKIDGTFVRGLVDDPVDCAMTEAIHRVGKVMGIRTIAEFVENRDIARRLSELGVDFGQGYGIHRPEPWITPSGSEGA
ncbi:MAG: EAL domain-containing protein [Gammaproteobacteria bacterium]|jgi:diguanylate cyclase (GGDEF)-like protein/PAS domain S-box-containing protein